MQTTKPCDFCGTPAEIPVLGWGRISPSDPPGGREITVCSECSASKAHSGHNLASGPHFSKKQIDQASNNATALAMLGALRSCVIDYERSRRWRWLWPTWNEEMRNGVLCGYKSVARQMRKPMNRDIRKLLFQGLREAALLLKK